MPDLSTAAAREPYQAKMIATLCDLLGEAAVLPREAETVSGERFTTSVLGVFSLGGMLMAAIGIYGVLAYSVSRRMREIGVQLALGASPTNVLRHVLLHAFVLVSSGLGVGLLGAFATARLVRSAIPELSTLDVGPMLAATLLLAFVASVATFVPARRAMRADPMEVLRAE